MSAIAINNRVTSDSDVAFASCTALPIHQTTLNIEEMAGLDGMCILGEVVSTVQDVASKVEEVVGEVLDDANTMASLYIFGGVVIESVHPPDPDVEYPIIIPNLMLF